MNARTDFRAANRVVEAVSAVARVECATNADLDVANSAVAAFGDQAFSLTDRIRWAIMERMSIVDALAFDADFAASGQWPVMRWRVITAMSRASTWMFQAASPGMPKTDLSRMAIRRTYLAEGGTQLRSVQRF